jgi:shikimate dehydrogenase
MGQGTSLAPLQALVDNVLPSEVSGALIGLIGDHPSTYARSPRIWWPALERFGIRALYLPLDVAPARLPAIVALLRRTEACLGANVTAPYKEAVIPLLDEIDAAARAIGAVNTIVRTPDGRLVGANTDGVGLVSALLRPHDSGSLVDTVYGLTVMLIGAGGAASAAAAALAPLLGSGRLLVTNRSHDRAQAVAARAVACGGRATAIPEDALEAHLPAVELVINASVRGQAGIHKEPNGWTTLESYSALGPAHPAVLQEGPRDASATEFLAAWRTRSAGDIDLNHATSRARIRLLPRNAAVYDMIYAPPETPTLRHAREAGLRGANGRWMNIAQAVEAFVEHICARPLAAGGDPQAARAEAARIMAGAWDA